MSDEAQMQNVEEWGEANRAELEKLTENRGEFTIPREVLASTPSDMWQAFINSLYWKMRDGHLALSHHVNVKDGSVTITWQPDSRGGRLPDTFKGIQQR